MRAAIDARIQRGLAATFKEGSSPLIERAMAQLTAYFEGRRECFELPVRTVGTAFQQRVWSALAEVRYGHTVTYAGLTGRIAEATAIRAVASANGANALSIIIPCHRVIGSDGELVGYAGGLAAKRRLLALEGACPQASDLFTGLDEAIGT